MVFIFFFFFSSRRRHTILQGDWSSDVCSSDLCAVRSRPYRGDGALQALEFNRQRRDWPGCHRRVGWMPRWKLVCLFARGSSYDREQPVPAHGPRPAPYHPGVLTFPNGKENNLGAADDVLERHIADLAENAAIGGIVAIVAHHEIMTGGHLIDRGIVVEAVIDEVERRVAHPVGQGFPPALDP